MNLKEFDAKQFLLEKGERIGLGVALTLMVLMLIFSLFMPSKGFFSGSPVEKEKTLKEATARLDNDLKNKPIPDSEKPEPTEGRKIAFDTIALRPSNYQILGVFQPASKENPARRPPTIYNIEEGVVAVAPVLIDTYLFSSDFSKIYVLREKDRGAAAAGAGGMNPFARAFGGGGANMTSPSAMPPGMNNQLRRTQGQFSLNRNISNLNGLAANDFEYDVKVIDVKDWNQQELTARQPRPLRVAVIGGSFPYRRQLEEFKKQLRLASIDAVLNEVLPEKEGESFKFLGVEVERVEVDADGKKLGDWNKLALAETYQIWLKHTFLPFQPENPQYNLVKMDGLVAPLLREFHANKKVDPTMRVPGMMMAPGRPQPPGQPAGEDFEADVKKTNYPDVVAALPKIQDTLGKLGNVQATRVPQTKTKAEDAPFDPFRPFAAPLADNAGARKDPMPAEAGAAPDLAVPEYMLMRLVDVNLEPGKSYRYRVRIKMNNPNYKHSDVASPAYKIDKELTSKSWYEIKQIARVAPELKYYVVDEKKEASQQDQRAMHQKRYVTAQARMWERNPKPDQVVFQLHRWVESTPLSSKESDVVPVGQWSVADRVLVNRGEFVGQKVRVDIPIWKYSQNAYVLPAEEPKKATRVSRLLTATGIDVDFGFDSSSLDTILVDFEGGRVLGPSKIDDNCRLEVLMLSPDGKLLARNNVKDTADEERKERRDSVIQRVEDIRQGKVAE